MHFNLQRFIKLLPKGTRYFEGYLRILGQGNIFRSVCQEFCPQGTMHGRGGMHGGGHVWQRGVHGSRVCMAGGMHGSRGHEWQIL